MLTAIFHERFHSNLVQFSLKVFINLDCNIAVTFREAYKKAYNGIFLKVVVIFYKDCGKLPLEYLLNLSLESFHAMWILQSFMKDFFYLQWYLP